MSRRQEFREKRRRRQIRQRFMVIILILAGAALIAAALILPSIQPVGDIVQITPVAYTAPVNMTAIGDPDAPVRVDVYADFQCPACATFAQERAPLIIQNYVETGKVYFVFHHFPFIDDKSATKESDQAASASMCAAEQGRFWDYHDIVYANWNGENRGAYNNRRLVAFAEAIDLNMNDFNACFDQGRYADQIRQDYADGRAIGVTGTPTVFVNGQIIMPGYVPPYEAIAEAIDAILGEQ